MQTIEEMIVRFPKLAAIVDDRWLHRPVLWLVRVVYHASAPWYEQLEDDLGILRVEIPGHMVNAGVKPARTSYPFFIAHSKRLDHNKRMNHSQSLNHSKRMKTQLYAILARVPSSIPMTQATWAFQ